MSFVSLADAQHRVFAHLFRPARLRRWGGKARRAQFILIMGCASSRTVAVSARRQTWNEKYAELSHEASNYFSMLRRERTQSLGEESTTSKILKQGNTVRSVNGYSFGGSLGKGAFGEVFTATKGKDRYAIKVLRKSALKKKRIGMMGSAYDSVKGEIATMKKIAHPNCVHMFDCIIDAAHDEIFLVLEFVEGGNSQKTDEQGNLVPLTEETIWSHMRHLVLGLEYLHMNNIVHRDIKPENLLVSKDGVLKVADFGTSCFCEGDSNAQRTAGTPTFFSPELCSKDVKGTYDARVVDLWAIGITLHLWLCGASPFTGETTMLLMASISNAPDKVPAPAVATKGLKAVVEGLLTRSPAKRLTLNQLRLHSWLTKHSSQPLPQQPMIPVSVTEEEIAQAFTSRAAMQYQSAAGPSALARVIGVPSDWKREDLNTIRKRTNGKEARFFRAIAGSGHLSPHIPVIYSIEPVAESEPRSGSLQELPIAEEEEGHGEWQEPRVSHMQSTLRADQVSAGAEDDAEDGPTTKYDIRMQDLASNMTRPCAMRFIMGNHTVTADEFQDTKVHSRLLEEMRGVDATMVSTEDDDAGGITRRRYLSLLDEISSTRELGFRIDGAQLTLPTGTRETCSVPEGKTLSNLHDEADICAMIATFLQKDERLADAIVLKLQTILAALERSAFFNDHVFLRSALLLTYDDAAREKRLELKLINFAFCYAVPDGQSVSHTAPWDGDAASHQDGYLFGMESLLRLMQRVAEQLRSMSVSDTI